MQQIKKLKLFQRTRKVSKKERMSFLKGRWLHKTMVQYASYCCSTNCYTQSPSNKVQCTPFIKQNRGFEILNKPKFPQLQRSGKNHIRGSLVVETT